VTILLVGVIDGWVPVDEDDRYVVDVVVVGLPLVGSVYAFDCVKVGGSGPPKTWLVPLDEKLFVVKELPVLLTVDWLLTNVVNMIRQNIITNFCFSVFVIFEFLY
jgi:hypothetical protein